MHPYKSVFIACIQLVSAAGAAIDRIERRNAQVESQTGHNAYVLDVHLVSTFRHADTHLIVQKKTTGFEENLVTCTGVDTEPVCAYLLILLIECAQVQEVINSGIATGERVIANAKQRIKIGVAAFEARKKMKIQLDRAGFDVVPGRRYIDGFIAGILQAGTHVPCCIVYNGAVKTCCIVIRLHIAGQVDHAAGQA